MVNNIRILLGALVFVGLATPASASEQDKLAKYNTDVSKSIRQSHLDKLAQTTYREINVKDARTSDDVSKVYPQIETKVTKDGSATRVVAEAVLNTDKEKVAKDWAKKLNTAAKFGTGVLGSAALGLMVNELLDAIDYVMGEGGQVIKKVTPDDPLHPTYQYYYEASSQLFGGKVQGKKFNSIQSACLAIDGSYHRDVGTITYKRFEQGSNSASCYYHPSQYGSSYESVYLSVNRKTNPSYDPNATSPTAPATENDIKDAIKTKVLDKAATDPTARNLAKNLVKDSYARIWDDKGNSLEIRGDVTNKQKDILNSNDPTSDGHTTSTPTISDGKSGSGSSDSSSSGTSEGTTFNPDGSIASSSVTTTTTTTSNTFEFKLPAFCDWASTVCEWLDWTKEEPEEPQLDDSISIDEIEIEATYTPHFLASFDATCPADIPLDLNIMGTTQHFVIPMAPFCTFFSSIRPFVIGLASLLAVYIIGNAARPGES